MLASLVVIGISVIAGFAVGGWYAYADANIGTWSGKVEHLKPHGRMSFFLWKIIGISIFLAGTALPFALGVGVIFVVAHFLSTDAPIAVVASPIVALVMIAAGNRIVERSLHHP